MPTPRKGESEKAFVTRCIPMVIAEEKGKTDGHANGSFAAAKCHGIYRQSKKRKK